VSAPVITIIVMGVIAAVLAAVRGLGRAKSLRRVNSAPMVPLGELAGREGQTVRVTGVVHADGSQLVSGPYTGIEGVVAIGERWENTSRGDRFRRLDRAVRDTPFAISNGTDSVRVVVGNVDYVVDLAEAKVATSGPNRVFGAGVIAANLNNAQSTLEGVIKPGDHVTAAGLLQRGASGGLELIGSKGAPLVVVHERV
jgi:hypothetical protein